MPDGGIPHVDLHFHPKQWYAYSTVATEVLYGGAAGGGKSHLMRQALVMWCMEIPGLQCYLFRRVEEDLVKNHVDGPKGFRNMLATLVNAGLCRIVETRITFWNGSTIHLCHCKDEKHRYKYHGAEIHVLAVDELTTFTETIYRYLRFRVRCVGLKKAGLIPEKYLAGKKNELGEINQHDLFPRILCGSNPGNIGHQWVKATFVARSDPTTATQMEDAEGGMVRQFIPARLEDNPTLLEDDPDYRQRMRGLGDPMLVRAMEEGDWSIIAGAYFQEFSLARHVLRAQTLPPQVFSRRFRAADWGSYRPFSVGWYAVCDKDWQATGTLGNQLLVPRGAIVRYREWYGVKTRGSSFEANVGIKMPVDLWAKGIWKRENKAECPAYTTVDPAMFNSIDGSPSLAERAEKTKSPWGETLKVRKAGNKREAGWDQLRFRLQGDDWDEERGPQGPAMLFLMDNQPHGIRIIEGLQHDELKPEDVDTDGEDHAGDEIRYACMSRPRARPQPEERVIAKGPKPWTIPWLEQGKYQTTQPVARVSRYTLPDS